MSKRPAEDGTSSSGGQTKKVQREKIDDFSSLIIPFFSIIYRLKIGFDYIFASHNRSGIEFNGAGHQCLEISE